MSIENLQSSVHEAIKVLRKKKLDQGLPFMINTDILESSQCFMEFPDGCIKIVEADPNKCDFRVVVEYSYTDSKKLKRKLNVT